MRRPIRDFPRQYIHCSPVVGLHRQNLGYPHEVNDATPRERRGFRRGRDPYNPVPRLRNPPDIGLAYRQRADAVKWIGRRSIVHGNDVGVESRCAHSSCSLFPAKIPWQTPPLRNPGPHTSRLPRRGADARFYQTNPILTPGVFGLAADPGLRVLAVTRGTYDSRTGLATPRSAGRG